MVTIFLTLRYNLILPFQLLTTYSLHLINTKKNILTGYHAIFISYSKIAPVAKPEVSTRTLLGKVGSKMLRTGA